MRLSVKVSTFAVFVLSLFVVFILPLSVSQADSGQVLDQSSSRSSGAVFVMTNDADDNEIFMYDRFSNGKIKYTSRVSTGGKGSFTQPIDPLTSQHSLILSEKNKYLLAANAGSDEISVFSVHNKSLRLVDRVPSNGFHPTSITINDDIVYVLNTGGDGSIAGFRMTGGKLRPIPGSIRNLGLNGTNPPQVNEVNHHILFNPNGDRLLVTGGTTTNAIFVYSVDSRGVVERQPRLTSSSGDNPFSMIFSRFGDLVVAEGEATNALSSYDLNEDNSLSVITPSLANGKSFSCWVVSNGNRFLYLVNTGTDDISLYQTDRKGVLRLVDADIAALGSGALQTDSAFSDDGAYLYTLNCGTGTVGVLQVDRSNGGLKLIQEATGLEDHAFRGLQGLAAY